MIIKLTRVDGHKKDGRSHERLVRQELCWVHGGGREGGRGVVAVVVLVDAFVDERPVRETVDVVSAGILVEEHQDCRENKPRKTMLHGWEVHRRVACEERWQNIEEVV